MTRKQLFYCYSIGAAKVARNELNRKAPQKEQPVQKSSGFTLGLTIIALAASPLVVAFAQGLI